jgi:hypothetical protein
MNDPRTYPDIGVQIPTIFLPRPGIDLTKWAVVACDQFTSQPEYWAEVEKTVGEAPSTLHMTLPEIYLGKPGEAGRIQRIQMKMREYLDDGLLEPATGLMYIERSVAGKTRRGLLLCLDLEQYDYQKGSQSLIRATEGTIIERLPPRIKIRESAALEFPHILVLIDDSQRTVIEPLAQAKDRLTMRYDFDLMLESGHLTGYQVDAPGLEDQVIQALRKLADPQDFARKYGESLDKGVLLFAMGDGNHSLATAKAIWERMKLQVGMDHPARYALVEIENVHDEGLEFEPIHRVVFGLKDSLLTALERHFGRNFSFTICKDRYEMEAMVEGSKGHISANLREQAFGLAIPDQFGVVQLSAGSSNLVVGSLQPVLDDLIQSGLAQGIDYVHGTEVLCRLASEPGNAGFLLPKMPKSDLFKTVILDGALPRKTFSMGEAREKRFYMEGRQIA